jgi:hypothetical protein
MIRPSQLLLVCLISGAAHAQASSVIKPPPGDLCHARAAKPLIGRAISEAPKPRHGYSHRFVCTTCQVTTDYNPRRLNFIFDEKTQKITALQCG